MVWIKSLDYDIYSGFNSYIPCSVFYFEEKSFKNNIVIMLSDSDVFEGNLSTNENRAHVVKNMPPKTVRSSFWISMIFFLLGAIMSIVTYNREDWVHFMISVFVLIFSVLGFALTVFFIVLRSKYGVEQNDTGQED